MEKKYKWLLLFFGLVALVSIAGFYNSYLIFFPDFNRFKLLIHFHFVVFIAWFVLLVLQPLYIKRKQMNTHRLLGKLSYIVALLMVVTIAMLVKEKIIRDIAVSINHAAINAFIGVADIVSFSTCYLIAIVNKKNTRWHVAFIIGASLIVLNPGMSRLLNSISAGIGLLASIVTPFIVSISIIVFEKIKLRRAVLKSPYFLFMMIWTFEILLLIIVPGTGFWQHAVINFANL